MKNNIKLLLFSVIFVIGRISAQQVTLKKLGTDNMFFRSGYPVTLNGAIYTLDYTSALYKTDLSTGAHSRVGNVTYGARFFFGVNYKLYTIEGDGRMDVIDPATGAWSVIASMGSWSTIEKVVVVQNSLYAIENGAFYQYPTINPRNRKQIGESDFYEVGMLIWGDSTLLSLQKDGTLYEINTGIGSWKKISKAKDWKYCKAGTVLNNKLYTFENKATLYETSLADGTKRLLDATQFKDGGLLFEDKGKLFTITAEGNLYEISVNG